MSHIRALERHLDTVHRKIEKSIKCPKEGCKYVTNSVYILQSHIKYMHDKVPRPKKTRHECPECGKKLAGIASRNRHLKFVHGRTDVKVNIYNYPCPKCDKVTMSKRWLLSHLVHKHGEKHVITRCPSELKPRSNKNKKIKRKMKKKKKEERDENDDNDEQEENDDNDEQEESKVAVANLLSNEVVLGL
jgi:ribosomal protein L34E